MYLTLILEVDDDILKNGVFVGQEVNTGTAKGNAPANARLFLNITELNAKQVDISIVSTIDGVNYELASFNKIKKPVVATEVAIACPARIRAIVTTKNVKKMKAKLFCERF